MKSYSATELCPFKDFNVNLTYGGAFQNMFVSAVGLATALVALTFWLNKVYFIAKSPKSIKEKIR